MFLPVWFFVGLGFLISPSLSCYYCFVDVSDSGRLCWGHVLTKQGIQNVDSCFKTLDRIFNKNEAVIEAGKVGGGYDKQLKEIMDAQILPLVKEFDQKRNYDSVYERMLQTAADNFIAAASKLPRISGCHPPCGFQDTGAVYNCITCQYDSCGFPLDCPVKDVNVTESSRSEMRCTVPFNVPDDAAVAWRFSQGLKTQLVDQFIELTVGEDRLYAIPQTRLHHQGTYQCEMYSGELSIVRLYFYLSVTPLNNSNHRAIQKFFDQALLPGSQFVPPDVSASSILPQLLLICLVSSLLLVFLSLVALYLFTTI